MSIPTIPELCASKGLRVIVAVGLTVAVTGYVVGLRQSRVESQRGAVYGRDRVVVNAADADVPTIIPYSKLGTKKLGPNRDWTTNLATLTQPAASSPPKKASSVKERESILAERAKRRAFDGAPPYIPHPTASISVSACLACHEKGISIGDKVASRMSHPVYGNCTQCHVEIASGEPDHANNSFLAFTASLGERASAGAPPAMPHPLWMRNECQSCHGSTGPQALRITHPERQNCLQCHATTSPIDQAPIARASTRVPR
jgi:cytochrome c-type protein NapB